MREPTFQLQDAIQRAEFNKTGSSSYHLRLNPVVHDPIIMVVPSGKSSVGLSPNGVVGTFIDLKWWTAQLKTLNGNLPYIDPTHLALYLTKDVLVASGNQFFAGFHTAATTPPIGNHGTGQNGNGDQPVQTWAWASYTFQADLTGPTAVPHGRTKTSTPLATRSRSGQMIRSLPTLWSLGR